MWIYIESDQCLFTTGFYRREDGLFQGDADFPTREQAAERVSFLNGGPDPRAIEHITTQLENIVEKLDRIPTNMKLGRE